mgnify:CR=1 FL=1
MSHLFHKIGYSLRHWSEVGITMQRKLTVYFACTVLVVFVAAVVLIQTAGIMPGSERDLGETADRTASEYSLCHDKADGSPDGKKHQTFGRNHVDNGADSDRTGKDICRYQ